MKRVLITGANSYVGTNVEKWLMREPENFYVETLDMRDPNWKNFDFSKFDVVFHVAGIAHIKETKKNIDQYFMVNRDLAVEVATKAKSSGVSQFIFMSTMAIYGLDGNIKTKQVINLSTKPNPKSSYGKSKFEAEERIVNMDSLSFKVLILRPPMVYGDGSPGNYNKLKKYIIKYRIVPKIKNERSIINISVLSETIREYIQNEQRGIKLPQDSKKFCFMDFVYDIEYEYKIRIIKSRILSFVIKKFMCNLTIFKKMFGSLIYDGDNNG